MQELAGHKLSDAVIERLPSLATLTPGGRISYSEVVAFHNVVREMDMIERYVPTHLYDNNHAQIEARIVREATARSPDGRIDQSDFTNYAAASSRYSLFTPMEAAIVFHFAGRGGGNSRLALVDFAQLLNPKWKAPQSQFQEVKEDKRTNVLNKTLHSAYNFVLGGMLMAGPFDIQATHRAILRCRRGVRRHGGIPY